MRSQNSLKMEIFYFAPCSWVFHKAGCLAGLFARAAVHSLPKFDVPAPHKAGLHFMPHDKVGCKVFKYVLTVVDVPSRFKEAKPLT